MNKKKIEEAVSLFQLQFGKTPAQNGYPVIDIYERQHAYLYATTQEAINAYKIQQNIIRWTINHSIWPAAINIVMMIYTVSKFKTADHPLIIAGMIFLICWVILHIFLICKSCIAQKVHEDKVLWLNY